MSMVNSGRGGGRGSRPGPRWLFGAIWLFYLNETLQALLHDATGWRRGLGLVALAGFCALYLYGIARSGRLRASGTPDPLRQRWLVLLGLILFMAAMVPGAGEHALAGAVFVAATAGMSLPIRQSVALVVVLFAAAEWLPRIVPGWEDNGYGLAVALASLAVWGLRTVIERNHQLFEAERRLAAAAVEHERARIAADLHDILGHSLTVITVKAELAARLIDIDPDRAQTEVKDLENLSRDALADVRSTALGLRGVSLPGEIAAARAALGAAGIDADLPTVADEVPTRWRELFAWTVRESVTNLVRHSGAGRCTVHLAPRSVEVLDDGRGAGSPPAGEGHGLDGLRERVRAAGARIEVGNRTDGPGFRVYVEVPA